VKNEGEFTYFNNAVLVGDLSEKRRISFRKFGELLLDKRLKIILHLMLYP
jgi:hypothetical protein